MDLIFRKISDKAVLPVYATKGSVGFDVCSINACVIEPGEIRLIETGLAVSLPYDMELQVRSRSGLAAKHGIAVLNAPGTIDSDYRGEIKIILKNHSKAGYKINFHDRIAQLVPAQVIRPSLLLSDTPLKPTERGEEGFGSTGRSFFRGDT